MKKRTWILIGWIAAMIFPLNWLRRESSFVRQNFDSVFRAEWVHVVAHYKVPSIALSDSRGNMWRMEGSDTARFGTPFLTGFTFHVSPHYVLGSRNVPTGKAWVPELEVRRLGRGTSGKKA